ncbi:hypothetical protein [Nitrososphaera sp. AFS]|uniref:hypothetical protein n=1 Tax=Nitrososphaera sp. AFS TaxID=2301191 RepID=UPI0013922145|nr:hypothetical protein [Nitrososphaera sp. AFS]
MNHTTLAMVVVLSAALVTGASLAIPLQQANASSNHHKKHGNGTNIRTTENQANTCTGNMAFCNNDLTNINCLHSICVIGDITPWVLATPY